MDRWICKDCGAHLAANSPKFCSSCGSQKLEKRTRLPWQENLKRKDIEFQRICEELTDASVIYLGLKAQYRKYMKYFLNQKIQGHITQSEYDRRASMFSTPKNKR